MMTIFETVIYIDCMAISSGLTATLMAFIAYLLGIEANVGALLLFGALNFAVAFHAAKGKEKLHKVTQGEPL